MTEPRADLGRWDLRVQQELEAIQAADRWRALRFLDAHGQTGTLADGTPIVSFAGNDYLGLSDHPDVAAAATEAIARWGAGATASRLVVGHRPVHHELEAELARWKGCERALVFPSGFQANLGVLATLGGPDVTVFSDELNHASIIDGCRLSRATVSVYRHADLDHLRELLGQAAGPTVVVSDSVFSMDGDAVDVAALAQLCGEFGALLVLDEAHAVFGPSVQPSELPCPVVRVGTLSKTLGSQGGFVAGPGPIVDLLINRARAFIFTTGLAPSSAAAALAALRIIGRDEGRQRIERLRALTDRFRPEHPSPILPVIIGEEAAAVAAAEALLEQGLLVPAIRPPTVPVGTSRLRIALSAAHTDEQVDRLQAALRELGTGHR